VLLVQNKGEEMRLLLAGVLVSLFLGIMMYDSAPVSSKLDMVTKPEPIKGEDPFNLINTALVKNGRIVDISVDEIPDSAFSDEPIDKKDVKYKGQEQTSEKIHPLLTQWLNERSENERELIVINFLDGVEIPRFPTPIIDEPCDSEANQKAMEGSEELVQEIEERRAEYYDKLADELLERYEANVLETFWLINGMLVEMPLRAVPRVAARQDVLYLEPNNTGVGPPQDRRNDNNVDDGQARDPCISIIFSYADAMKIEYTEAEHRLQLQNEMSLVEQKIVEDNAYFTSWIQHNPTFGLIVSFTASDGDERIQQYLEGIEWADLVIIRESDITRDELMNMHKKIVQEVNKLDIEFRTYLNYQTSQVQIHSERVNELRVTLETNDEILSLMDRIRFINESGDIPNAQNLIYLPIVNNNTDTNMD